MSGSLNEWTFWPEYLALLIKHKHSHDLLTTALAHEAKSWVAGFSDQDLEKIFFRIEPRKGNIWDFWFTLNATSNKDLWVAFFYPDVKKDLKLVN